MITTRQSAISCSATESTTTEALCRFPDLVRDPFVFCMLVEPDFPVPMPMRCADPAGQRCARFLTFPSRTCSIFKSTQECGTHDYHSTRDPFVFCMLVEPDFPVPMPMRCADPCFVRSSRNARFLTFPSRTCSIFKSTQECGTHDYHSTECDLVFCHGMTISSRSYAFR
jgi:uncharacterized protein YcgL (UPF0745 family)